MSDFIRDYFVEVSVNQSEDLKKFTSDDLPGVASAQLGGST